MVGSLLQVAGVVGMRVLAPVSGVTIVLLLVFVMSEAVVKVPLPCGIGTTGVELTAPSAGCYVDLMGLDGGVKQVDHLPGSLTY